MIAQQTLSADWATAQSGIDKVVAFIKAAQANPAVEALERAFPGFGADAAQVVGLLPDVALAEAGIALLIEYGPMICAFLEHAGVRPMDANDIARTNADKGADFPD